MSEKDSGLDRRGLVARIVAAAACVLIAVSAASLAAYQSGGDPLAFLGADALKTVAEEEPEAAEPEAGEEATPGEKTSADEGPSEDEPAAADTEKPEGSASDASAGDGAGSSQGGSSASGAAGSSGSGSSSGSGAGSSSGGSTSSTPAPAPEPAPQPSTITVTVSIDGSAGGSGSSSTTVTLSQGATVYDALLATGAGVNAHGSAFGMYVAAIDGLAEKEHGGESGWKYSVNGVVPNRASSAYTLSGGESVRWYYVLNAND